MIIFHLFPIILHPLLKYSIVYLGQMIQIVISPTISVKFKVTFINSPQIPAKYDSPRMDKNLPSTTGTPVSSLSNLGTHIKSLWSTILSDDDDLDSLPTNTSARNPTSPASFHDVTAQTYRLTVATKVIVTSYTPLKPTVGSAVPGNDDGLKQTSDATEKTLAQRKQIMEKYLRIVSGGTPVLRVLPQFVVGEDTGLHLPLCNQQYYADSLRTARNDVVGGERDEWLSLFDTPSNGLPSSMTTWPVAQHSCMVHPLYHILVQEMLESSMLVGNPSKCKEALRSTQSLLPDPAWGMSPSGSLLGEIMSVKVREGADAKTSPETTKPLADRQLVTVHFSSLVGGI